jgi:hypothetical protein
MRRFGGRDRWPKRMPPSLRDRRRRDIQRSYHRGPPPTGQDCADSRLTLARVGVGVVFARDRQIRHRLCRSFQARALGRRIDRLYRPSRRRRERQPEGTELPRPQVSRKPRRRVFQIPDVTCRCGGHQGGQWNSEARGRHRPLTSGKCGAGYNDRSVRLSHVSGVAESAFRRLERMPKGWGGPFPNPFFAPIAITATGAKNQKCP